MKTLLQINVSSNWGSTGKIAEQIGVCAQSHGWNSYVIYGRKCNPSKNHSLKVGTMLDVYEHYVENRFLDSEGLASRRSTKSILSAIDRIKPDIVQLHNLHDHYLNYPFLFKYLCQEKIPIVWTQHDLWSVTGHCYYAPSDCHKWMQQCFDCPAIPILCQDKSARNYKYKRDCFTSVENMTIVPVSDWLGNQIKKSFLKDYPMNVIKNGVDINMFKPSDTSGVLSKYNLHAKHLLLAVAAVWDDRKNITDYIRLSQYLPQDYMMVLVGLTKEQLKFLPSNIKGIERTQNQAELAQLYSTADVLLSLSNGETFGMTMAESLACGTPCIVYDNTAQPEVLTADTGCVVRTGDINALVKTIKDMIERNFKQLHSADCRKRAVDYFDKDKCFEKYIELYESLIK